MNVLLIVALLFYLTSAIYALITLAAEQSRARASHWLRLLVGVGFVVHTLSLAFSWQQLGHFPVVNLKEVCSFLAWAIAAYYLIFIPRDKARALPIFVLLCGFLLTLVSLLLPNEPLSLTLSSAISASPFTQIIFPLHVTMLIFSYAAFVVTVAGGVMYLVQEHELKTKHFGAAFRWMPALNTCDELSYRSLTIGFVLLTLGIFTGMMWGSQHDGRFWHNDPKEVLALVTWFVYLAMIHYRVTAGWRGRRVAWMAIGGFVAVLLTFIGARAMGGYHVFG
jgi:cytochrome c-type biogenesis protein CcsB